jgi:hypothetical protein
LRCGEAEVTMATDERDRLALHRRLEQVLGPEHAVTLVASLPPPDDRVATARDLARIEVRFDHLESRMERLEARMERLEEGMDGLYVEIRAQTRTYLVANTGLIATVAALAFGAARSV